MNLTSHNKYDTLMYGLRIFAPLICHLTGNVTSATVDVIVINLQPEYELHSSIRFGQFQKFGKI